MDDEDAEEEEEEEDDAEEEVRFRVSQASFHSGAAWWGARGGRKGRQGITRCWLLSMSLRGKSTSKAEPRMFIMYEVRQ